jgi:putative hydrolase of the HAD superfamily
MRSRVTLQESDRPVFEALLIDLGNVLVRFDHGRTLRAISAAAEPAGVVDPDSLRAALFGPLEREFDSGRLDAPEFFRKAERAAGLPLLPDEVWVPAWRDIFEPIPESLDLLSRLRPGVRTCLVSNTNRLHWEGVRSVCDVADRVDALALSFQAGLVKPDAAFFRSALDLVGATPGQAVFADDRPDFVEAARALGIDGITVTGPAALEDGLRLRRLLRAAPSPPAPART